MGFAAEGYEEYLNLSLALVVYVPMGRWAEIDVEVAKRDVTTASNRLVWLALLTGQALRRGQLDVVDVHLPELRESALASEEPQRIVPMASIASARALLGGDERLVAELADAVQAVGLANTSNWALGLLGVSRSLAAIADRDRLARLVESLPEPIHGGVPATIRKVCRALLARLDGDSATAATLLLEAEQEAVAWDRPYDAACIALEAAQALDGGAAEQVQARAAAFLEPLGCVNPY